MNDQPTFAFFPPFHAESPLNQGTEPALAPVLDPAGRIPAPVDARLAALARRAQLGDTAARNALFLALWPRCVPMVRRLRRSDYWRSLEGRSWTFDDLEQEAFIVFCDLVVDWRGGEPRFAGYFFSRFPWRLRDLLRRWSRTIRLDRPMVDDIEQGFDPSDAIELRAVIESRFANLPSRDRALIDMRVVEGLTDAEIALRFGVCVKTVRRWRARAFQRARMALGGETTGGASSIARLSGDGDRFRG